MAKASFTTFLLLATLALLATVAAQSTPGSSISPVATTTTTTTTTPAGTATTTAPTGSATPPPAYTNSVNFSSLANVISNFASAKPPAATGTATAGNAGNTVGPHMGAAAVVLAAVVAMF
ncbi:hypothetical protein CPB97_000368 [Podila verticillata]|nr:hypothetical protein CPB97_000368 [Podila verticillata]